MQPGYDAPVHRVDPQKKICHLDTDVRVYNPSQVDESPAFVQAALLDGASEIFEKSNMHLSLLDAVGKRRVGIAKDILESVEILHGGFAFKIARIGFNGVEEAGR